MSIEHLTLPIEFQRRWQTMIQRLGLRSDGDDTAGRLFAAYTAPGRYYHNAEHLAACLAWLDAVRDQTPNGDEIELALWFHDAVYDARGADNEERSADWARQFLRRAEAKDDLIRRVIGLVLATDHRRPPQTEDEIWIVDIDLSILGSAPPTYAAYEEAIRMEYAWVDAPVFRVKRAQVLRSFLERAQIFGTRYFQARLEVQARQNLSWALGQLEVLHDPLL